MITIRPAGSGDAEVIVEFQLQLAGESEGLSLQPPTLARGVRAVLADPAIGEYLLAEVDGQVVGCLLLLKEWSDWRNGTVLWVHSLYVGAEFRRRGVFRAFHEHLRGVVEADDSLLGLRLYVAEGNAPAQAAYQAAGMSSGRYRLYEWLK